jgi:hypothetical protein
VTVKDDIYVDYWGEQLHRATINVTQEYRTARVTYRSEDGKRRFRVNVVQKPNPIGFHARLPGSK